VLVYEFPRPSPYLVNLGKTVETLLMTKVPIIVVRLARGGEGGYLRSLGGGRVRHSRGEEYVPIPNSSITIVTAGLFLLYWVYTLTKDSNKHFESHGVIERDILVALRELYLKAQP
jgi:hypothetical protein